MLSKSELVEYFKQGKTDREIAELDGRSRQAITLHRKKCQKEGLVEPRKRGRRPGSNGHSNGNLPRAAKTNRSPYSWTEIQEALLVTMQQAKNVEALTEDNRRLKNRVALLETEVSALKDKERGEKAYNLLVQQGELPGPLSDRRNYGGGYFTYHISSLNQFFELNADIKQVAARN